MNCKGGGCFLTCTCLVLSLAPAPAADVPSQRAHDRAVAPRKLFPQITEGIYNAQGQLVMDCQIGSDGLTVTGSCLVRFRPERKRQAMEFQPDALYGKTTG